MSRARHDEKRRASPKLSNERLQQGKTRERIAAPLNEKHRYLDVEKMPRALVSRNSSTVMPRSTARPERSASATDGRTPTPTTTKSASSVPPPLSVTV